MKIRNIWDTICIPFHCYEIYFQL